MLEMSDFIMSELLVLVPVLLFIGNTIKKHNFFSHKYIPIFLGACGVFLSTIYVFAATETISPSQIALAFFTAFTQGILVAAASVYLNQIKKQRHKPYPCDKKPQTKTPQNLL